MSAGRAVCTVCDHSRILAYLFVNCISIRELPGTKRGAGEARRDRRFRGYEALCATAFMAAAEG